MFTLKRIVYLLIIMFVFTVAGCTSGKESKTKTESEVGIGKDGVMQENKASYVDVYYNNAFGSDFNVFTADTQHYKLDYALSYGSLQSLAIKDGKAPDKNILSDELYSFSPAIKVKSEWYKAVQYNNNDHMVVRKAGMNMWEIQVRDIRLANQDKRTLPMKVNQIFYFWNEKLYITTEWVPEEDIEGIEYAEINTFVKKGIFDKYNVGDDDKNIPDSGEVASGQLYDHVTVFDSNKSTHGSFSYQIINKSGTESLFVKSGKYDGSNEEAIIFIQRTYDKDKNSGESDTWKSSFKKKSYTQMFVSGENSSKAGKDDTYAEMNPLDSSAFQVTKSFPNEGSRFLGYDNIVGAYDIEVFTPDENYFITKKNNYPSVKLDMKNDNIKRKIRIKTQIALTGSSIFPPAITGGVSLLADENMIPNGIPVQISKKWDNHPNGTNYEAYYHTYASFDLAVNEQKTMWHRTIYQNWGNKVSVGLPSLDISNYYNMGDLWLESHVGIAEAMCYLPDNPWNATGCDFRAMTTNLKQGKSDPWFPNAGGYEFLSLHNGKKWIDAKRRGPGIRFDSIGPNLSKFQMNMRTPEGEPDVKVHVTSTLIPSDNGTRVFHKLRYDFLSDYSFNDIQKELSFFSMGDPRYESHPVKKVAYTSNTGEVSVVDVSHSSKWDIVGAELSPSSPWVALYESTTNNYGFIVKEFNASLNGEKVEKAALSLWSAPGKQTAYLVPGTQGNKVKAGDYVEVLIEAFTWSVDEDYTTIQNEATKWPVNLTVEKGSKIEGFPAGIQVAEDETAEFSWEGGIDYVPLEIKGFSTYSRPLLEEYVDSDWKIVDQSMEINDFWQTQIDPTSGKYTIIFALPANETVKKYRIKMIEAQKPEIPDSQPRVKSKQAFINEFVLDEQAVEAEIDWVKRTVVIKVKNHADITKLRPLIKVSDYATVSPASGEECDFSQPVTYTVTSEDGFKHKWKVTVEKLPPGIKAIKLNEQEKEAFIDSGRNKITVTVKTGVDITALAPQIELTQGAKISPASGQAQNFTKPVKYTLTGIDGKEYIWDIIVKQADSITVKSDVDMKKITADSLHWSMDAKSSVKSEGDSLIVYTPEGYAIYQGEKYGDVIFDFNMSVDESNQGLNWPAVSIRNKQTDQILWGKENEGYIAVFKKDIIELQRFNQGKRTMFYGENGTEGPGYKNNVFNYNQSNRIQFGALNTDKGVRLVLTINGVSVFDYLDTEGIKEPGYFSLYAYAKPVSISHIEDK